MFMKRHGLANLPCRIWMCEGNGRNGEARRKCREQAMIIPGRANQTGYSLIPARSRNFPVEYYILSHVAFAGAVVGSLADQPIRETVIDEAGQRYRFAGLACRDSNGRYDVFSLQAGEWIVEPGLIYVAEQ